MPTLAGGESEDLPTWTILRNILSQLRRTHLPRRAVNKGQVARCFQQVDKLPSREFRRDLGSAFPAQPRLSGSNDGVCPICYLQFRKDVGDVVAYGVGADIQA